MTIALISTYSTILFPPIFPEASPPGLPDGREIWPNLATMLPTLTHHRRDYMVVLKPQVRNKRAGR